MNTLAQIRKVADQYARQGYEVVLRPRRQNVPAFLGDFQPDLIARKAGESVIVQLTNRRELARNPQLPFVADAVTSNAGWRLDLVVDGEQSPWPDPVADANEPSPRDIAALVESSRRLSSLGELTGACLTAWSAIEASLRAIAATNSLPRDLKNPIAVLKTVYAHGLLARAEYSLLAETMRVRNAAAHGLRPSSLSPELVKSLLELAGRLAAAASRPAA